MTKARDLANLISTGNPLSDGAVSVAEISDLTASAAELNKLDGVTASTAELNQIVGATSALQTQLDNISVTSGSLTKTFVQNETADITLSQGITSAPVVSATKEVPQTGVSTKGNWDVNSTASNYDFHSTAANVTLTPSNVGYDISSASYDSVYVSTGIGLNDVAISSDGTRIYYVANSGYVYQRTLSTAFDLSTAGSATSYDHSTQDNSARDITFKTDGYKMYVTGDQNNRIFQYSLSTAWDVTTASYDNKSFHTANQTSNPYSTQFKSDGTKMYVKDGTRIYEYNLSTAWDVTTVSYTTNNFTLTSQDSSPRGIFLKPDGTKMYMVGSSTDQVYEYNFGTAWDLSTLSYSNNSSPSFTSSNSLPLGLTFSSDGTKMYLVDNSSLYITQYSTAQVGLVLGSGSFASTDVGKRIVGNGGDVILTSTGGAFSTTGGSAFTDSSTIAAGSWQMFGLKSAGDADGITMSGFSNIAFAWGGYTATFSISSTAASNVTPLSLTSNSNGSKWFVLNQTNTTMYEFTASTAGDITTLSYTRAMSLPSWGHTGSAALSAAGDGSRFYASGATNETLYQTSTSNGSLNGIGSWTGYALLPSNDDPAEVFWKPDGTKLYVKGTSSVSNPNPSGMTYTSIGSYLYSWDVSTPWDISTTSNRQQVFTPQSGYCSAAIIDNGTRVLLGKYTDTVYWAYKLTTAWDITSIDYAAESTINATSLNPAAASSEGAIGMHFVNDKVYTVAYDSKEITEWPWGETSTLTQPTSQYHVGVTNTSGRIDSSAFVDINSMTAAQVAGSGTVNYAVSTDGRTTWSVAKNTDGVRPIVRNNSGTWQYNNNNGTANGYDISSPTYAQSLSVNNAGTDPTGLCWKPDGTKLYVSNNAGDRVNQWNLSTAWDLSTATDAPHSGVLYTGSQETSPMGVQIKSDGTKMYIVGSSSDRLYEYSLTTAWESYPYSYNSVSFSFANEDTTCTDIFFKPDGTQLFLAGNANDKVFAYSLSTAWDLSTMSYSNVSFDISSYESAIKGLTFSADGTKMFTYGTNFVSEWALSTAWNISTASYTRAYSTSSQAASAEAIAFKDDGTTMYTVVADGGTNQKVNQYTTGSIGYGTSVTWANGTVNDELYTLQQALGAQAFNRMDKTQLDAVADANHFPTGSSLDLMIALRMDAAAATVPTSDGVTLNYDAAALNEGAVLGTDYDFFFPSSTKVQIKSLAAQNLKVRVV